MKHKLVVDSVNKYYKNKLILSDINLVCNTGDVIAILGRNGSGKSTLLKIIFGSINCQNKFIKLDNFIINKESYKYNNITYLPQDNFIPLNLSVENTIKLFIEKNHLEEFCNDYLISNIRSRKNFQLSGGEIRYFETRLILYSKSKFSLLDEPFNGISPIQVENVKKRIKESCINKGIILTDHNYNAVLDIATKIYYLQNGILKVINNKEELVNFGYLNFLQ